MISTKLGYHHHGKNCFFYYSLNLTNADYWTGVEYWQHASPPSEATTVECNAEGEDPACSASIPSRGVNIAHTMVCVFFRIVSITFG